MKITNMNQLIEHQIQDLYSAEKQLVTALPKLAEASSDTELKKAFEHHLTQTKEHAERLEAVAEMLEMDVKGAKCSGMEGLVTEGSETVKGVEEGPVLDAALVGAAQRVEHYEMAGYGTLITHLEENGNNNAADILKETLAEEEEANEKLSELAETGINDKALSAGKDEE